MTSRGLRKGWWYIQYLGKCGLMNILRTVYCSIVTCYINSFCIIQMNTLRLIANRNFSLSKFHSFHKETDIAEYFTSDGDTWCLCWHPIWHIVGCFQVIGKVWEIQFYQDPITFGLQNVKVVQRSNCFPQIHIFQ